MALKYKFDILTELKKNGYNTNRIRTEKLLSESTLQKFRQNEIVSADNIAKLCKLLDCQPGDILEYVPDENNSTENKE